MASENADLVGVVSERIQLTARGSSHVGMCPAQTGKKPSLYVHKDRQFFHCFEHRVSGGVSAFLVHIESPSQ